MSEALHEPIPDCNYNERDVCVACSEAEDRCVPYPCNYIIKENMDAFREQTDQGWKLDGVDR